MGNKLSTLTDVELGTHIASLGSEYKDYKELFIIDGIDGSRVALCKDKAEVLGLLDALGISNKTHQNSLVSRFMLYREISRYKTDSVDNSKKPIITTSELAVACRLMRSDPTEATSIYGKIRDWDITSITEPPMSTGSQQHFEILKRADQCKRNGNWNRRQNFMMVVSPFLKRDDCAAGAVAERNPIHDVFGVEGLNRNIMRFI